MKLGLSSYSLNREIARGAMTLEGAIDWAAAQGAECMELVPFAFRFDDPDTLAIDYGRIAAIRKHARDAGIELVNYSVLANLLVEGEEREKAIERVCHEVDIAAELGMPRMRHDISAFRRPLDQNTLKDFDDLLPVMIEATQRICEHGRKRGVKTLLENHGFFVNGCDRVERVLNGVNNDNYGLLLDTGNIICVDEDPAVAAVTLAHRCEMVHLKDFYVRTRDPGDSTQFDCGGRWFRSRGGKYLRGSILGQGDLDVYAALKALKDSGYDGPIAIEFEGLEDPTYASAVSLANARRIWDEV
ncbi:MAG TPA: sugar phosphate isomerase/epimerase [Clostridiales bacterium]|jgi:sugar phosphate isomerase/epimerase|nr:sugar phosphate isomerase/epimerase [Clostridiales bacterium]